MPLSRRKSNGPPRGSILVPERTPLHVMQAVNWLVGPGLRRECTPKASFRKTRCIEKDKSLIHLVARPSLSVWPLIAHFFCTGLRLGLTMKILLPARRALGEWGGRRPERHQRAKMVVVKTPSKGKPSIGKSIRNLSTVTRACGQKWVNAYPLPGEEWPLVSAFFRSRDQAGSPLRIGLSRSPRPREWPLFADTVEKAVKYSL
jgi:hypothetical protein